MKENTDQQWWIIHLRSGEAIKFFGAVQIEFEPGGELKRFSWKQFVINKGDTALIYINPEDVAAITAIAEGES